MILVTGGTGLVGAHLLYALINDSFVASVAPEGRGGISFSIIILLIS